MATFPRLSYVCPIRWSEMRGDEKERYCSKCSRTVANISLLTEAQRVALLNSVTSDRLCVAYYRRLSGEFVGAENPLTVEERRTLVRYGAAALAVGGALVAAANFDVRPNEALSKARDEVTSAYHALETELETNTKELVDSLTAPFLPKKDPLVTMTLGIVVCPPTPFPGGSLPSAAEPPAQIERSAEL